MNLNFYLNTRLFFRTRSNLKCHISHNHTVKKKIEDKQIITRNDLIPQPEGVKEELVTTHEMEEMLDGSLVPEAKVSVSDNNTELIDIINSMLEKVEGVWTCKKCGKTDKLNNLCKVKRHIETHIEGMAHPCDFCGKTFR